MKQPRAQGALKLVAKHRDGKSVIKTLYQSGALKCLFPHQSASCTQSGLDAVLLNTAGGITGGDQIHSEITATAQSSLTLTTQACERAYKAQPGEMGQVTAHLKIAAEARINWLPQETILYEGAALTRRLTADLEDTAALLLVEPVIFGRIAMGEILRRGYFSDHIEIRRNGTAIYRDATRLSGDLSAELARPAVAAGAGAMATLVFVAPSAEAKLAPLRALLPATAGASLRAPDLLVARLLATDGFALRQSLLPILKLLNTNHIPRCWMT